MAPEDAFARLRAQTDPAWLDSSLQRADDGRYSIMACNPAWVFTAREDRWERCHRSGEYHSGLRNALAEFDRLLEAWRLDPASGPALPFQTGAIGWLSYDLGRHFEAIPQLTQDDLGVPDMRVAWYNEALVWDHRETQLWLVSAGNAHSGGTIEDLLARQPVNRSAAGPETADAVSDFTRDEYLSAVTAVRAGIARGEYYQLNLVQRFECAEREPPAATYLRLRALNPAPFAAFLQTSDIAVLCSSPERFVHVLADGAIRTCPIKGTRPRGRDAADDEARRAELAASPKERAELLMIVDLLRNDLGRVCEPGSIEVSRLHALESFATVHHLVGEVRGTLCPGTRREQLLRAVFPGGSITGAPKVSAMRAIETLERHRRGIAMGTIGYFSAHGEIDLNIAIRTAVVRSQRVHISVGAGIVWDSDPAMEYAETLAKAEPLFAAFGVRPHDR